MKNIIKFSLFTCMLLMLTITFGISTVKASITAWDEAGTTELTGTIDLGDITYSESKSIVLTLKNSFAYSVYFSSATYDNSKLSYRFSNPSIEANSETKLTVIMNYTERINVGTLSDTLSFVGTLSNNAGKTNFSINLTSNIIPEEVVKPTIDPSANLVYEPGLNYGTPFYNNSYKTSAMNMSGDTNAINAGNYTVEVTLENNNYVWADGGREAITLNWSIDKKTESLSGNTYTGIVGQTLKTVSLPSGWSWDDENIIIEEGNKTYKASYVATDRNNYYDVNGADVSLTGNKQYLVKVPTDVFVTSNPNTDFNLLKGENKDVALTAVNGYEFTSIKVNGVEQLSDTALTYTINITNISEDITIETVTRKIPITPIEGDNQKLTVGKFKDVVFKFDIDFDTFKHSYLKLNGVTITDTSLYSFSKGSVILTLSEELVSTLDVGNHEVEIGLESGDIAIANLVIEDLTNPSTGDNIIIYVIVLVISTICLIAIAFYRKLCKTNEKGIN